MNDENNQLIAAPRRMTWRLAAVLWSETILFLIPLAILEVNAGTESFWEIAFVGYAFGILVAQPLVAGALAGLVRSHFVSALLLTAGWNLTVIAAWTIQLYRFYYLSLDSEALIIAATPFVLWLINVAMFRVLRWSKRIAVTLSAVEALKSHPGKISIALADLFHITVIAAVALAAGRIAFLSETVRNSDYLVWAFLSLAPVLFMSPMIFASLLPTRRWVGIVATGLFGVLVTAVEISVWGLLGSSGPTAFEFIAINGWASLFVLALIASMRMCGLQLMVTPKRGTAAATEPTEDAEFDFH